MLVLLPGESFFFVTAAAGFLLERFFVEVLVIDVRVDFRSRAHRADFRD